MDHVKWLNFAFGPLSNGSKTCFWSRSNKWKWIRNGISDSLSMTWWWTLRIPTKIEIRSCDHLFRSKTRVDQQWITHMHTKHHVTIWSEFWSGLKWTPCTAYILVLIGSFFQTLWCVFVCWNEQKGVGD